jgi:hypothetical protein
MSGLLSAGSRPAAARHEEAEQCGQGLLVPAPLGVAAAVVPYRAAPDGVAGGAVPIADSAHAPAPAARRRRATAGAAPDRPRGQEREGGQRRQGGSVRWRPCAVQVIWLLNSEFVTLVTPDNLAARG